MKKTMTLMVALVCLGTYILGQEKPTSPDLTSLVESERAFARTSVEKGVRASFTQFFAEDGLNFTPAPVNIQERYRKQPAPTSPQPYTLNWEPVFADISLRGDLGYTTGPFVLTSSDGKQPSRYGYYFSVWKKLADGTWRVLLDYGINTPPPDDPTKRIPFNSPPPSSWKNPEVQSDAEGARKALMNLERTLSSQAEVGKITSGFEQFAMDYLRLHRNDLLPILGKKSALAYLTNQQLKRLSFAPLESGVSEATDLGFTYGTYELEKVALPTRVEKGYFLRVWKRDDRGNWKIVADISSPLPSE